MDGVLLLLLLLLLLLHGGVDGAPHQYSLELVASCLIYADVRAMTFYYC